VGFCLVTVTVAVSVNSSTVVTDVEVKEDVIRASSIRPDVHVVHVGEIIPENEALDVEQRAKVSVGFPRHHLDSMIGSKVGFYPSRILVMVGIVISSTCADDCSSRASCGEKLNLVAHTENLGDEGEGGVTEQGGSKDLHELLVLVGEVGGSGAEPR